ncbi:MAG: hypothetical protein EOO95_03090 [Pedobacter sp.]|nr:MAG: hypothetical protein EOO95_03090 [Pedobacter sp.]
MASYSLPDRNPLRSPSVREIPTYYSPYPDLIPPIQYHASTTQGWEFLCMNLSILEADPKYAGSRVQAGMDKTWI